MKGLGYYLQNNTKTLRQQNQLVENSLCYFKDKHIYFDTSSTLEKEVTGMEELLNHIDEESNCVVFDNIKSLLYFGFSGDIQTYYLKFGDDDKLKKIKFEAIKKLYGYSDLRFLETPMFNSENFFRMIDVNGKSINVPVGLDDDILNRFIRSFNYIDEEIKFFYEDNYEAIQKELQETVDFNFELDFDGNVIVGEELTQEQQKKLELIKEEVRYLTNINFSVLNDPIEYMTNFGEHDETYPSGYERIFIDMIANRKYLNKFVSYEINQFSYINTLMWFRNCMYSISYIIKKMIFIQMLNLFGETRNKREAYRKSSEKKGLEQKKTNSYDKKYADVYRAIIDMSKSFYGKKKDTEIMKILVEEYGMKMSERTYRSIKADLLSRFKDKDKSDVLDELNGIFNSKEEIDY